MEPDSLIVCFMGIAGVLVAVMTYIEPSHRDLSLNITNIAAVLFDVSIFFLGLVIA